MPRREQIARAAIRRLNVDPSATMAEIAEAAGISRATLNRHFASREDLMSYLGRLSIDSWRQVLDDAGVDAAVADGTREVLSTALDELCHHWIRDVEEYGFALTESAAYGDPVLIADIEALHVREYEYFAAAQKAGVLRDDVPHVWIAHVAFGLLVGLREALRRGDIAVRDAERLLREALLRGIAAPE